MDFSPDGWGFFPTEDFNSACPRDPGELGMEVMAQVRATGRILDHFRIALGGTNILEAKIPVKQIFACSAELPDWNLVYATWPRDVGIRRNMASSPWADVRDLLAANDARLVDDQGTDMEAKDLLATLDQAGGNKGLVSSSFRWAVCAGEDNRLHLHLQCLPAAESAFSGKPIFKG